MLTNADIYPNGAYICFDRKEENKREKEFKLGDSCLTYAKYFDLDCEELKSASRFEQTLETRGQFGATFTKIAFELDSVKRLNKFTANWSHASSSNKVARKEFYDVVKRNAIGCLWEQSLNIYKDNDTLSNVYYDGYVESFLSDFTGSRWTITYTCTLR